MPLSNAERWQRWAKRHPDRVVLWNERRSLAMRAWRMENPDKFRAKCRESKLRTRFGISVEQFEAMEKEQGGLCAICKKRPDGKRKTLFVDHCHVTGKVRGLLCNGCNTLIALAGENVVTLESAIRYLAEQ